MTPVNVPVFRRQAGKPASSLREGGAGALNLRTFLSWNGLPFFDVKRISG
jgi:hypothetical protein